MPAKRKELKQKGKGNIPNRSLEISQENEMLLWEKEALGFQTPDQLIHTVWYFCTQLLGFRGCHEARQLKFGDLTIIRNQTDISVEYIEREADKNQKW